MTSPRFIGLISTLLLASCGGGSGSSPAPTPTPAPVPTPTPAPVAYTPIAAATTTATSDPLCIAIAPFYWEIGDRNGAIVSASVDSTTPDGTQHTHYDATTRLSIASSSKWMYAAYVVQLRSGSITDQDIAFLTLESGYTNMIAGGCDPSQTVDQCLASPGISATVGDGTQGALDPHAVGLFDYGGGHMTKHASLVMGLGGDNIAALTTAIEPVLAQGTALVMRYTQGDVSGGVYTSGGDYALFLRSILADRLVMHDALGTHAVCTNPSTCTTALYSPIDGPNDTLSDESWNYSIGHWVEVDPTLQSDGTRLGDGAFSSPGAYGFYPWIDAGKTTYGIVSRQSQNGDHASTSCGRQIRKAYLTASIPAAPTLPK